MTLTLDISSETERVLLEAAHLQGKTPERLAAETLQASFAALNAYPTARQLLAMPEAQRDRYLSEAAAHAAPLYEADLALPPEQRELTAMTAVQDDFYEYPEEPIHG